MVIQYHTFTSMTKWSLLLISILFGCVQNSEKFVQPDLGYRTVNILNVDGYQFKDLNRNGFVDSYEDWRLSVQERSEDLLAEMTLEQKAGFMLISSTRLENDWSFGRPLTFDPITSGFNETDQTTTRNIFTKEPLKVPTMSIAGTTKDVKEFHKRHFILRANPSAKIIADWSNNLQALCEEQPLGIPAIVTSNPRNHITKRCSSWFERG